MSMVGPERRFASLWRLAFVGLVVASTAAGLVGHSGMALPLVVSSILLLALAVAVVALVQQAPAIASGGPARRRPAESRHAARQCDPNAPGHARPRAPSPVASRCP
jgi:tellurite resistance protein TehA-like permease